MTRVTKNGFTMSELITTISIIGVVAALVLPAFVARYQKEGWVAGLKKSSSFISQAASTITFENQVNSWNVTDNDIKSVQAVYDHFKKELKLLEDCGCNVGKTKTNCWSEEVTKTLSGDPYEFEYPGGIGLDACHAILVDGSNISFDISGASDKLLGTKNKASFVINIDINGKKGPNMLGRDVFVYTFDPEKNAITSAGSANDSPLCSESSDSKWSGVDCAAKISVDEKMDY